jgi:hypothetical protein
MEAGAEQHPRPGRPGGPGEEGQQQERDRALHQGEEQDGGEAVDAQLHYRVPPGVEQSRAKDREEDGERHGVWNGTMAPRGHGPRDVPVVAEGRSDMFPA